MIEALLAFIIVVVVVCVVAGFVLWAVQKWVPEAYPPARMLVGAVALIVILYQLLELVRRAPWSMP